MTAELPKLYVLNYSKVKLKKIFNLKLTLYINYFISSTFYNTFDAVPLTSVINEKS